MDLSVTVLPVGDAAGGSVTQELTYSATAREGRPRRGVGGYWSQRHRAINYEKKYNCDKSFSLLNNHFIIIIINANMHMRYGPLFHDQSKGRGVTCGTSKLIAAVRTVCVAVTHPGVDDTSPRATVEAVGGAGRYTRGQSVRSNTIYKVGSTSEMMGGGWERELIILGECKTGSIKICIIVHPLLFIIYQ